MAREIDRKKTRKALKKLRRARDRAESEEGARLTEWEREFTEGVETRLEKYGSAFNDPEKGRLDEPLSHRQMAIIHQIGKKSRPGKPAASRSTFRNKKSRTFRGNSRDINDDLDEG